MLAPETGSALLLGVPPFVALAPATPRCGVAAGPPSAQGACPLRGAGRTRRPCPAVGPSPSFAGLPGGGAGRSRPRPLGRRAFLRWGLLWLRLRPFPFRAPSVAPPCCSFAACGAASARCAAVRSAPAVVAAPPAIASLIGRRGSAVASFSVVGSVPAVLASAFAVGCSGLPSVSVGPSGRLCARPLFPSAVPGRCFARQWAAALGRPVVVRPAPCGCCWSVSVPVAPPPAPSCRPRPALPAGAGKS